MKTSITQAPMKSFWIAVAFDFSKLDKMITEWQENESSIVNDECIWGKPISCSFFAGALMVDCEIEHI